MNWKVFRLVFEGWIRADLGAVLGQKGGRLGGFRGGDLERRFGGYFGAKRG
jgi:hypothetical protein